MIKNKIIISFTTLGFLIFGLIFLYSYYNEKKLDEKLITYVNKNIEEEFEIVVEQHLYDVTTQEPSELNKKFSKKRAQMYQKLIMKKVSDILYPEKKGVVNNSKKLTEDERKINRFNNTIKEEVVKRILTGALSRHDLPQMLKEKTDSMLSRMKLFIRVYSILTSLLFLFLGIIFLKFAKKRARLLSPLILIMISVLLLSIQYFYSQEWFSKAIIDDMLATIIIIYYVIIFITLLFKTFTQEED